MKSLRSALVFCIAAALAGCAGTHGSAPLPSSNQIPPATSRSSFAAGTGTLTFQIGIPTFGASNSYVSPATKGMTLSWTGTANGQKAFNLTRNDAGCVRDKKLVCTFNVSFNAGSYQATFDLYDEAPVKGQIPFNANLLSVATKVAFTIASGQTTTVAPTLRGVPASLSVGPMPIVCAAIPPTVFPVIAFDADSDKIVGAYANTITLSDSDTSGATTIATSGKDHPHTDKMISSFDKATITWNGSAIPDGSATINAVAGGTTSGAVFTPQTATSGSASFNYTGGEQTFAVPACATTIYVVADGAGGGSSVSGGSVGNYAGGLGGETGATIPTTSGEVLNIFVGGAGDVQGDKGAGGYNGGGAGAPYDGGCGGFGDMCYMGAGGGGGTDVRQGGSALSSRVIVAGGGGGVGACLPAGEGGGASGGSGGGGAPPCTALSQNGCLSIGPPVGGGGGTQTAGGAAGGGDNPGVSGAGGAGESSCDGGFGAELSIGSGGGGGGWFGGGGGGPNNPTQDEGGGGGGGGSAYAEPSATNVYELGGLLNNSGNGFVFICWGYSNQMCGSSSVKKLMARARHSLVHGSSAPLETLKSRP